MNLGNVWSQAEDDIMLAKYEELGLTGLANSGLLDRTYDSIKNRARHLHLTRPDRKNAPKTPRREPPVWGKSCITQEHIDGFALLRGWYRNRRRKLRVRRVALVAML